MALPLSKDKFGTPTAFVFGELRRILGPVVSRRRLTPEPPKGP